MRVTNGDSASVQAVTRVNAEQAKRTMRRPTRRPFRGRLTRLGYRAKPYAALPRRTPNSDIRLNNELQSSRLQRNLPRVAISRAVHLHANKNRWRASPWKRSSNHTVGAASMPPVESQSW